MIPEQGIDPAAVDRSSAARAVTAAVTAVLPVFLVAALSVQIRAELSFGTAALGAVVAIYFVTGAITSVPLGQAVELLRAGRGLALAASISAVAMIAASLAQSWVQLAGALVLAGLANALAQPAANLLLSVSIPVRRLGLAFGIKQSCVPGAALIGGLAVPTVALVVGWRWAFALAGALTAAYAAWLWSAHSGRGVARSPRTGTLRDSEAAVSSLLFLTAGGFLGAAAATSLGAFLVDSAVVSGFAPSTAGWVYAAMAWGTVSSRVVLGWVVDRSPTRSRFGLIALLLGTGALGYVLLAVGQPLLFLVGAALGFVVGWAWTGIFHYAVVTWYRKAPAAATGLAQTGLSLGAGIGPLLFGITVEQTSYRVAWLGAGGVSLVAALTVLGARAHLRAHRRTPSVTP